MRLRIRKKNLSYHRFPLHSNSFTQLPHRFLTPYQSDGYIVSDIFI